MEITERMKIYKEFYKNKHKNKVIKCVLCGKIQALKANGKKTKFDKHHIDYEKDITIVLCWACHMIIHGRLRFRSPWEAKYGKDKAFYELAKAFITVYEAIL